MIGTKIGSYAIVEELGRGTATTTFLARNDRGKQGVAKRLFDKLAVDETIHGRFLGASEVSAKIRMRKNVATISGQKSSSEGTFLLREYVEGKPLFEALSNRTLTEPEAKRQVVVGLCDAVRALATRGVVHGGIHPGNVIVRPDGRIKLTDFGTGLATLRQKVPTSYPLHALRYLAPEQWRGEEPTSGADIYAVGLIVFALLLNDGNEPFEAEDREGLMARIRKGCGADCQVLAPAVHPSPARRYPDVDKFRKGLIEKYFPPVDDDEEEKKGKGKGKEDARKRKEDEEKLRREKEEKQRREKEKQAEEERKDATEEGQGGGEETREKQEAKPSGVLKSIFDVKAGNALPLKSPTVLCKISRDGRRQQRPFQLSNAGPGRLDVLVSCVGKGISTSPERLDISPGRVLGLIVNVEPDSDPFTNVAFRWSEKDQEKTFTIKICHTT